MKVYLFLMVTMAGLLSCSQPKEIVYNKYQHLKVEKLGFGKTDVTLDLQYYNPNNFGLQLRQTDLDIFLNDTYLGKSVLDTLIVIPRRDTFTIPIHFSVDMKNLLRNALTSLSGKEIDVRVLGKIKVGKANVFMQMPINYEGKHNFSVF